MKAALLEHCASDLAVVNAARVSFASHSDEMTSKDAGLIGFLMREGHGSPFEHGYLRFHVEAPIFVFREWHRHRTGHSFSEVSGRYVELERKFYEPATFRVQGGKPGAYTFEDIGPNKHYTGLMEAVYAAAWESYQALLDEGVAKEQARAVLPVGLYTQMHWSVNPRSLMHFLSLRTSEFAMKEIRDLAEQVEEQWAEVMPATAAAFEYNGRTSP